MFIIKIIALWALLFPVIGVTVWACSVRESYSSVLKGGVRPYLAFTFLFMAVTSLVYALFYWR